MDKEVDYTMVISEVVSGKSISRSLLDLGHGEILREYILGGSRLNRLERFIYRYNDAIQYIELRSTWSYIANKFKRKVRSLHRRIELLNLLLVVIISSLNPLLKMLLAIRGVLTTKLMDIRIDEILKGATEIDLILNLYGVLQIILTTYLLSHTEYFEKRVTKKLILYLLIYYLVSGFFRAFTSALLS